MNTQGYYYWIGRIFRGSLWWEEGQKRCPEPKVFCNMGNWLFLENREVAAEGLVLFLFFSSIMVSLLVQRESTSGDVWILFNDFCLPCTKGAVSRFWLLRLSFPRAAGLESLVLRTEDSRPENIMFWKSPTFLECNWVLREKLRCSAGSHFQCSRAPTLCQ
jgi:hypothetical protein